MNTSRKSWPVDERWFLLVFAIVLVYKIYACFQVPAITSDVLRHLGYSSHALENGFNIYETVAKDFKPEAWTRHYSKQTYIYPPVTLIFFYLFTTLHLGILWVKLVLTLIDLGCAYLFYRHVSKWAAFLYFCAPVSMWYTSHEGQFEVLQTLFISLTAISVNERQWSLAGFWLAISIQVKQFGVLLLPWVVYEMWKNKNEKISFVQLVTRGFQGGILGFLPFIAFYIRSPLLLILPITQGTKRSYNPFAWNIFKPDLFDWNPEILVFWNALFSYTPLIILGIVGLLALRSRKFATTISTIPLVLFWFVTKSLKWGQFWYSIIAPGFLFCLSRKSLIHVLLLLHLMQCLHSSSAIVAFIKPTEIIQPEVTPTQSKSSLGFIGGRESFDSLTLLQSCMVSCDPGRIVSNPRE